MAAGLPQTATIPMPATTSTVGSAIPAILGQPGQISGRPFLDVPLRQLPPPELPPTQVPAQAASVAQSESGLSQVISQPHPVVATVAAPGLPPLPAHPVDALMQGLHLPGMPGVDQVISPLLGLVNSFGSGILGAVNPANILQEGAQVMESATQTGGQALSQVLTQGWQGGAAQAAHASGKQLATKGAQVSRQGMTIADITNRAADQVNRSYQQLVGIVRDFATLAVPIATTGTILTPGGQLALMGAATTAFARATAVVGQTQTALAGLTTEVNAAGGLVQVLANSIDPNIANQMTQAAPPAISNVIKTLFDGHESGNADRSSTTSSSSPQLGPEESQTGAASYPSETTDTSQGDQGGLAGASGTLPDGDGGVDLPDQTDEPHGRPTEPSGGAVTPLTEPTLGSAPVSGSQIQTGAASAAAGPTTATSSAQSSMAPVGGVPPALGTSLRGEIQHLTPAKYHHPTVLQAENPGMEVAPAALGSMDDPEADKRYENEYGYYSEHDSEPGRTSREA